jgi:diadenosine tetraphosphate (Ap4A) HIT family hydrolase
MDPKKCPFCFPLEEDILVRNELCYARYDLNPVNPGHMLIIPFRHVPDYFSLSPEERNALLSLVDRCRGIADARYHPDGYNFGINSGEAAGQTVPHVHLHFIPRYCGDVAYSRGGIRSVIPGKRDYLPDMPEE